MVSDELNDITSKRQSENYRCDLRLLQTEGCLPLQEESLL